MNATSPFPIDAVYTWVDVASAEHREALAKRLLDVRGTPRSARSENRFRDLGTLAWSIRALLHFAPWIRTVHLVTDGRTPPELPTDARIRIVPHVEFFRDAGHLPTFSSYAIEANLGFVPGLAERFVYFNDDMFLGRPAAPDLFFDASGRAVCRFDDPLPRRHLLSRLSCRLRRDLRLDTQILSAHVVRSSLPDHGHGHPAAQDGRLRRTSHQACASRASVLRALWDHSHIGPEIRRTSARPFRDWGGVCPFTLMALVACHEGTAYAGQRVTSAVRFVRDRDLVDDVPFRTLLEERPALFCLNDDVQQRPDLARVRIGAFLSAYFGDSGPI